MRVKKKRLKNDLCLGPKHESIVEDRKEAAKKDEAEDEADGCPLFRPEARVHC